jgi:membrane-bound serine protease (ClpP class)
MLLALTFNPDAALLLLSLGVLGIYTEFCAPGKVIPGAIGAVLATLGLVSLSRFPISAPGVFSIVLAFALFALEARFVSRGIFTLGGAVVLLAGMKNLIVTADPARSVKWATALWVAIPVSIATSFLLSVAMRARRNKAVRVEGDMLK